MRDTLESLHPMTVFLYFSVVAVIEIFTLHPAVCVLSLLGAAAQYAAFHGAKNPKIHLYALLLILSCAVANPLFSHAGKTLLFTVLGRRVTLQAVCYGLCAGMTVAAVFYRFSVFSAVMTSDKLQHVIGRVSPKAALTLSVALRFIPMYMRQAREIKDARVAMGLYRDGGLRARVSGSFAVFSALLSATLEKSVITSDSMSARGCDGGRRSRFSFFRFAPRDFAVIAATAVFGAVFAVCAFSGGAEFVFYPDFSFVSGTKTVLACAAFGALNLLPFITEGCEKLKWRYLISKI